ncbi:MAG: DinB family protein [Thermomicrobiales bacterium]
MSDATKDRLLVDPLPGYQPEIGRALWGLEDSRRRTTKVLNGIDPFVIDWTPGGENTIGTLLYHIAAIEADWLHAEVLEQETFPPEAAALFPHDVRDNQGRLTVVAGLSLEEHLARLAAVRAQVLAAFRGMTPAEFHRPRDLPSYSVSPAWVIQHLMQHEAEHRGQIDALRMRAELETEPAGD